MSKFFKKVVSVFSIIALLLTQLQVNELSPFTLGVVAGAETREPNPASDFEYTVGNASVNITKYIGDGIDVVVPDTIEGKPCYFGASAIQNCKEPINLTLPNTIKKIRDYEFRGCDKLKSIVIPNGVDRIGVGAFYGCTNMIDVVIPDSVTVIAGQAFDSCWSLTEIFIPKNVKTINDAYIKVCTAFLACFNLESITVDEDNPVYSSQDGVLFKKDTDTGEISLEYYPAGKKDATYTVPGFVSVISTYSFCSNYEGVPASFASLPSLETLIVSEGVTTIGTDDGNVVFRGINKLKEIYLPNSVTKIGALAFSAAGQIYCHENSYAHKYAIGYGFPFVLLDNSDNSYKYTITFDSKGGSEVNPITDIVLGAKITKPTDPTRNGYTFIGWYKEAGLINAWDFDNDTVTADITLYAKWAVTTTKADFEYKKNSTSVTITGYTGAGGEIVIPDTIDGLPVTDFGTTFKGLKNITGVIIPYGVETIAESAFSACINMTDIVIPDSVTFIGNFAFDDCQSLISVYIPDSVEQIGSGSTLPCHIFRYCYNLENVRLPEGLEYICGFMFFDCPKLKNITIPESVTKIVWGGFQRTGLTTINIPKNVTNIELLAFADCAELESITVDEDNPVYSSQDGVLFKKDKRTGEISLVQYPTGKKDATYTVPDFVSVINEYSFCGSGNPRGYFLYLETLIISDGVTTIGTNNYDAVFGWLKKLESLYIPNSVTKMTSVDLMLYCDEVKIYCHENSYAHTYAVENKIPFVLIESSPIPDDEITVTPYNAAYDGDSHSISVSDTKQDSVITYSADGGVNYISENPAYTDVGTYTVKFKIERTDTDFDPYYGESTITITKAAAPDIDYPSAETITYGAKLSTSSLIGGSTEYGTFAWTDGEVVPTVNNDGYEVTFTQTNGNYETIQPVTDIVNITVKKSGAILSGVDNLCQVKENTPKNYKFSLSKLLPVRDGLTGVDCSLDITYNDGLLDETAFSYTGGGILVLPVLDVDSGKTAEITVTISSDNYEDFAALITIESIAKNPVKITDVKAAGGTYNGDTFGYTGTPVITNLTDDSVVEDVELEVLYEGINGTVYNSSEPPVNAGEYILTLSVPEYNEEFSGSQSYDFAIAKKEVIVKADDKTIKQGETLPDATVTYTGFIGSDNETNAVETLAVAKLNVIDSSVAGTSVIDFSKNAVLNNVNGANYTLSPQNGLLTINSLNSECDVVSVSDALILNGANITAKVSNGAKNVHIQVNVSKGALWALYSDSACTTEISDKEMSLEVGANTAYIKVIAEDGITYKVYTVTITRANPSTNNSSNSGSSGGGVARTIGEDNTTTVAENAVNTVTDTIISIINSSPIFDKNKSLIKVESDSNAFTGKVIFNISQSESANEIFNQLFGSLDNVFPFDLSIFNAETNEIIQPKDGQNVKITLPIPEQFQSRYDDIQVMTVQNGSLIVLKTNFVKNDDVWCVVFETNHFSPYALVVSQNLPVTTEETDSPIDVSEPVKQQDKKEERQDEDDDDYGYDESNGGGSGGYDSVNGSGTSENDESPNTGVESSFTTAVIASVAALIGFVSALRRKNS